MDKIIEELKDTNGICYPIMYKNITDMVDDVFVMVFPLIFYIGKDCNRIKRCCDV